MGEYDPVPGETEKGTGSAMVILFIIIFALIAKHQKQRDERKQAGTDP